MDCNLPGFYVHGIFQARVLEWVAISFSRGSSWPKYQTQVSCIASRRFTLWATREACLIIFPKQIGQSVLWATEYMRTIKVSIISKIQRQCFGYTYSRQVSLAFPKFKFSQVSNISSGNPTLTDTQEMSSQWESMWTPRLPHYCGCWVVQLIGHIWLCNPMDCSP